MLLLVLLIDVVLSMHSNDRITSLRRERSRNDNKERKFDPSHVDDENVYDPYISLRNELKIRDMNKYRQYKSETNGNEPQVMDKLKPIIRSQLRTKTYMTLMLNGYRRVKILKNLLKNLQQDSHITDNETPQIWRDAALKMSNG